MAAAIVKGIVAYQKLTAPPAPPTPPAAKPAKSKTDSGKN